MQDSWRKKNGLPRLYNQSAEIEPMSLEAVFMMEKRAQDKNFARITDESADTSILARENLMQERRLKTGYRTLSKEVRARNYPELPSLEARAKSSMNFYGDVIRMIWEEEQRRAKLPPPQRRALEENGSAKLQDGFFPWEDWQKSMRGANAEALRAEAARMAKLRSDIPEAFAQYRARYAQIKTAVLKKRTELLAGTAAAPSAIGGRMTVPSPVLIPDKVE